MFVLPGLLSSLHGSHQKPEKGVVSCSDGISARAQLYTGRNWRADGNHGSIRALVVWRLRIILALRPEAGVYILSCSSQRQWWQSW